MTDNPTHPPSGDDDGAAIEGLLPFYVTGKLSDEERQIVERHLADDPHLGQQLELIREEQLAFVSINEAMAEAPVSARARLFQDIDREAAEAGAATAPGGQKWWHQIGGRLAGLINSLAPAQRGLAAAALLVLVLGQAIAIGILLGGEPAGRGYVTATGDPSTAAPGTSLLVQFTSQARLSDIGALLENMAATIVAGPRSAGLYQVRIGDESMDQKEIERVMGVLRGRTDLVQFVGRMK